MAKPFLQTLTLPFSFSFSLSRSLSLSVSLALLAGLAPLEGAAATKAHKPKAHGAIALDRNSDAWGYGINQKTSREARLEALRNCDRPSCEVVLRIEGECGALARKKGSNTPVSYMKFSSSRGTNRAEAETKALRLCGKDCEPIAWACNR